MREVVFKNLYSVSSKKRDVFLREVYQKAGVMAKTERRSFYYVKNVAPVVENNDLNKFIESQNAAGGANGKRRFHIMKDHNDSSGKDKLICKIAGTFYAVVNNKIYTIAFLHSFKVSFDKTPMTN